MKPYTWRFGAEQGPIPGRAPRRKQQRAPKAEVVVGVDAAAGVPSTVLSEWIEIGELQSVTYTNALAADPGLTVESMLVAFEKLKADLPKIVRAQGQFALRPIERPDAYAPSYGMSIRVSRAMVEADPHALDLFDRCPICGHVECGWWAQTKEWMAANERRSWRDGSIDVELAKEHLLAAGKEEA